MTHKQAVRRWLRAGGIGVEIGAYKSPIPGISPFYVDRFAEFAGEKCHADYWGDACHLPFRSHSLDYVVTSHVLEHVANPVAALLEWHRVVRSGGMMYFVAPDRRFTFDHARELTTPEHMWSDFERAMTHRDVTHLDEFIDRVDWAQYSPQTPSQDVPARQEAMRRSHHQYVREGGEINIHYHVFESSNLRALVELAATRLNLDWTVVEQQEHFPDECPNGILMVVRVRKHGRLWWQSRCNQLRARLDRRYVVASDARPLAAEAELRRAH
jgi:SAM-dependent methyltransferase